MDELRIDRGRLSSPSSHPLRELVIRLFDGISEDSRKGKKPNPSKDKPSWNSLLKNINKNLKDN